MRPENAVRLHSAGGTVPTHRAALNHPDILSNHIMRGVVQSAPYVLTLDRGETAPEYTRVRPPIVEEFVKVYNREQDPGVALERAREIWQALIDERLSKE